MNTSTPWPRLSPTESVEAIQRLSVVPKMLETVCQVTGMRFAAVARVTDDRWTACAVLDQLNFGLEPGGDLVLDSTICNEIRQHHQAVIFGHASNHPVFSTHHTPRMYGLESYVSIPILDEHGEFFGTLCAIDSEPRDFDEDTVVATMTLFAGLIASNLSLQNRARDAEAALREEVDTGILREQFLAVVGHDLRSPLQGARLMTEALGDLQTSEQGGHLVEHLLQCMNRMSGLIDDIMDFARGRLGGGLTLSRVERDDLADVVQAVVTEVCEGQPHCRIHLEGTLAATVPFDGKRVRQLLANLLNNAVSHGNSSEVIRVRIGIEDEAALIAVTNQGEPIAPDTLDHLFEPFVRQKSSARSLGLGLGLYIASEIAKGHGGTLSVTSSRDEGTTFSLSLPLAGR